MDADRRREAVDLLASGRFQAAVSFLTKGIADEIAKDPEVYYLLGVAHFRLGHFSAAESNLRSAISLDPMRADAFYYLGLSAERQRRTDDALKAYGTAMALDPTLDKAREKLGKLGGPWPGQAASTGPPGPKLRPKQIESELILPSEDADFADYERRKRRKAEIDLRADRDAKISMLHSLPQVIPQLPWWVKLWWGVFAAIGIAVVLIALSVFFDDDRQNEGQQAVEDAQKRHEEARRNICNAARQQGQTLPGC